MSEKVVVERGGSYASGGGAIGTVNVFVLSPGEIKVLPDEAHGPPWNVRDLIRDIGRRLSEWSGPEEWG